MLTAMSASLAQCVGVAVITGAASGLGRATAVELARRWFDIVAVGPEGDELHVTASMLGDTGRRSIAVKADVSQSAELQQVSAAATRLGGASALVNNAAIYPSRPWDEISEEEWGRALAVNLTGAFLCCRALVSPLREAHGSIVNIASNTFVIGWSG
jgi:3-oxoacyl-[acyl-carrier protein] reductase